MNEVTVTWLGHACFRLSFRGWSLITDPYADDTVPGLPRLRASAGAVYCSHSHEDHCARELIRENRMAPPPDFSVEEYSCPHDHHGGARRGMVTVRIFRFGSLRAAHLGDLGCRPEESVMEALRGVDLLLIPIGGTYTVGTAEALSLVSELKPRAVVPMHYRTESFGFPVLETPDAFLAAFAEKTLLPGPSFSLTADSPRGLVVPRFTGEG